MKKFLNIFFVVLGVIFFIILVVLAYLWFADPFDIRKFVENRPVPDIAVTQNGDETTTTSTGQNPSATITPAQADALRLVGMDPELISQGFSSSTIACFVEKFGQTRVDEIVAGATPTASEILTGQSCLE